VQKLKRTSAGISGVCAQGLQCMMTDQRTAQCIIIDMVRAVWYTDDPIDESWYVGLTSCLPKKGDLSQPCNWRCIVLLEVTSKVVCNICRGRLGLHWLLHLPPQP
jgi:hypothetical protein